MRLTAFLIGSHHDLSDKVGQNPGSQLELGKNKYHLLNRIFCPLYDSPMAHRELSCGC